MTAFTRPLEEMQAEILGWRPKFSCCWRGDSVIPSWKQNRLKYCDDLIHEKAEGDSSFCAGKVAE
jgi:hypothetical protein